MRLLGFALPLALLSEPLVAQPTPSAPPAVLDQDAACFVATNGVSMRIRQVNQALSPENETQVQMLERAGSLFMGIISERYAADRLRQALTTAYTQSGGPTQQILADCIARYRSSLARLQQANDAARPRE